MIWPATNLSAETVGMKMGTPSHYDLDARAEMCTLGRVSERIFCPLKSARSCSFVVPRRHR